jgi:hypothetical protein
MGDYFQKNIENSSAKLHLCSKLSTSFWINIKYGMMKNGLQPHIGFWRSNPEYRL